MAKTLSELTNDVKFKADWRTLDRVKSRMKGLEKDGNRLRKGLAKPLKMRMDAGGLGRAKTQMHGLGKEASRLRQLLERPMRVRVDGGGLASVRAQMRATQTAAGGLSSRLLALGAGFAIGSTVTNMATGLFNTNVEMARLQGALNTTMGSAAAGNVQFEKLQKFGATTPFTLDQSIQAFVKLKNLGLDPSEAAMRSYGNTATAMGKSMMDMIEAVADASTGEFERLKEFGIKSKSQGDMVEFTFQNVKTKVKKDAKSIEKYLMSIGRTKFGKAMADQMNSLPGVVSNVQDAFQNLQLQIGKGGMNAALIPILKEIGSVLSGIDGAALGASIGAFITGAANAARLLIGGLKGVVKALGGIEGVAKIAGGALAVMMAPIIGGKIIAAVKGIQAIVLAVKGMSAMGMASGIFAALGGIPLLVGGAVIAIGLLAYDIYKFATGGKSVIGSLAAKFPQFASAVKGVGDAFNAAWPQIREFFFFIADLAGQAAQGFAIMGAMAAQAFGGHIVNGIATAINFVSALVQAVWTVITTVGQVGGAFLAAIGQAAIGLGLFAADLMSVIGSALGWAVAQFQMFAARAIARVMSILGPVIAVFNAIRAAIAAFVGAALSLLQGLWNSAIAAAQRFFSSVLSGIGGVRSAFAGLGGAIISAFAGAINTVKGIINSLSGTVSGIINKIKGASSAAGKVSMGLPGGGRGSYSPTFSNGGQTFHIYDGDASKVGAALDRSLMGASRSQISDFARSVPVMMPGIG